MAAVAGARARARTRRELPARSTRTKMSALDGLRAAGTLVVVDSGNLKLLAAARATDATTNPSLIFAAAKMPEYAHLVADAVAHAKAAGGAPADALALALDKLAVNFGVEISKIVPGYVSTEVDASLSFDAAASVARGRRLGALYEAAGVPRARVLVKLASRWEGIQAARALEAEGIACNLTLLFSFAQAAAAAAAGATLISPFVGRITDWHKKARGGADIAVADDPGVASVKAIWAAYKRAGVKTIVMGASFRSPAQVLALAGCDRLTISPAIIEQLAASAEAVAPALTPAFAAAAGGPNMPAALSEADFRLALNADAMATEKLAEGIRGFSADLRALEDIIRPMLA